MTNVATLQTAADLSASITAQGISSLVPAGAILAFGGATAPTGWLLCEGALVSRTTYANLYAAILNAHGSGDGTTTFALPDYRGRFIRGRDGAVTRDPNAATRTAANTGGNTGDNVGSVQPNAAARPATTAFSGTAAATGSATLTAHQHGPAIGGTNFVTSGSGVAASIQVGGSSYIQQGLTSSANIDHSHSVSISGGGDNETRPLNAYVNYIIKI